MNKASVAEFSRIRIKCLFSWSGFNQLPPKKTSQRSFYSTFFLCSIAALIWYSIPFELCICLIHQNLANPEYCMHSKCSATKQPNRWQGSSLDETTVKNQEGLFAHSIKQVQAAKCQCGLQNNMNIIILDFNVMKASGVVGL